MSSKPSQKRFSLYRLAMQNSRRGRKENGLFFSSLVVSIVAFYIILALSKQDVMVFLKTMESDAVNHLLEIATVFYVFTLVILFFLIYYASKYQLERRKHELGMYLMLGMKRSKLFGLLLMEDTGSSIAALVTGLPIAILASEIISLVTAKLAGIGIIQHRISFSLQAVLLTMAGFVAIKLGAFVILSGKMARRQIGELLAESPEGEKKQYPGWVYAFAGIAGAVMLGIAYYLAINGYAWVSILGMSVTLVLGLVGTVLVFYGFRIVLEKITGVVSTEKPLSVFNFRQIQENVASKSGTLAVSSILILAALCCCGAGVGICIERNDEEHVLDYTFDTNGMDVREDNRELHRLLEDSGVADDFSEIFDMTLGRLDVAEDEDFDKAVDMGDVLAAIDGLPASDKREIIRNNMSYMTYPYLIRLSDYNRLLAIAGKPELSLGENELGLYTDFSNYMTDALVNQVLAEETQVNLQGRKCLLTGTLQTTKLVTDSAITLSFAFIVPDELFDSVVDSNLEIYVNGVLKKELVESQGLMNAIMCENDKLANVDFEGIYANYESYLQNMGRSMFYTVAAGYVTIYLAIVFLIIANTIIGVQFLMGQRKSGRRYRTLARLGATYEMLRLAARRQINWYFGLPITVAAVGSLFGVRALLTGILSNAMHEEIVGILIIAGVMIILLLVVECIYMTAVKKSSDRYLLTLMTPEREE